MKVSRQFLHDFAFLANHYRWTPADIEDVKSDTRANPDLVHYWTTLANAHRTGYEQTAENGFIRLHKWCEQQGRPNPFHQAERNTAHKLNRFFNQGDTAHNQKGKTMEKPEPIRVGQDKESRNPRSKGEAGKPFIGGN